MPTRCLPLVLLAAGLAAAQEQPPAQAQEPPAPNEQGATLARAEAATGDFVVKAGTKVPLNLINSVSTKHSAEGDRVYLESSFPILVDGRIVIPVGSYVVGTVTQIKKPGRVKGRGELYVRFDTLTLPNGVTRDFHARIGGMDGTANSELDRDEGKVKSEGNKGGDARTIGEAASAGASVGAIAGSVAGHAPMGLGIGAGAGAAAGLIGVLLTRGPDAVLAKGSSVEMVLDRNLAFNENEINFGGYQPARTVVIQAPADGSKSNSPLGFPPRGF